MILHKYYTLRPWTPILRCYFCTRNDNLKTLCKHLLIDESTGKHLQVRYPYIEKVDEHRINSLIHTLNELGFSKNLLLDQPSLFSISATKIKIRYIILQECGLQDISSENIVKFFKIVRKQPIKSLKESGIISHTLNVEQKLKSYMPDCPKLLRKLVKEEDKYTLAVLRCKVIEQYLELNLNFTQDELQKSLTQYPYIKTSPLQFISKMLIMLQKEIDMPLSTIKSNLCLLQGNPDNLKDIVHKLQHLGGFNVKELIKKQPNVAIRKYSTLLEIRNILDEYGISNEAQKNAIRIYNLSPDTIRERLKSSREIPEFAQFYNHHKFMLLILRYNYALEKLNKLSDAEKKVIKISDLYVSYKEYK